MIYFEDNKAKEAYYATKEAYYAIKEAYYGDKLVWRKSGGGGDVVLKGFVDLGLPSGLLWATRNIGATHLYEVGNTYHWGDTEEYIAMRDIQGTQYDIATKEWGETHWGTMWMMPNIYQWQELVDSCDWSYVDPILPVGSNRIRYAIGTSKYNQSTIRFPYRKITSDTDYYEGRYWTSMKTSDLAYPYFTRFLGMSIYLEQIHDPGTMGISINYVRAVAMPS